MRRVKRALDRADAADDDDDEGDDDDVVAHADAGLGDRRDQHAGESGHGRAEREHEQEQAIDVDAERLDHGAVGRAGANQHAEPRAVDQEIQNRRHRQAGDDDQQAITRQHEAPIA